MGRPLPRAIESGAAWEADGVIKTRTRRAHQRDEAGDTAPEGSAGSPMTCRGSRHHAPSMLAATGRCDRQTRRSETTPRHRRREGWRATRGRAGRTTDRTPTPPESDRRGGERGPEELKDEGSKGGNTGTTPTGRGGRLRARGASPVGSTKTRPGCAAGAGRAGAPGELCDVLVGRSSGSSSARLGAVASPPNVHTATLLADDGCPRWRGEELRDAARAASGPNQIPDNGDDTADQRATVSARRTSRVIDDSSGRCERAHQQRKRSCWKGCDRDGDTRADDHKRRGNVTGPRRS